MFQFRLSEFTKGVGDSVRVWQSFQSSRTLRSIAWRLFPLHATTIILGLWFHTFDRYGLYPEDWLKHTVLWTTWTVLWGAPVYVLGSLLQLRYASHIRSAATSHREKSGENRSINHVIVQTLYGALLNLTFLFQVWFINTIIALLLPASTSALLRTAFSLVNVSWATSFAAFESRLIIKNQDLFQRVFFVESHWAYALGYGTIISLIYHIVPGAIANGLWQYGVLILMLNAMRLPLLKLPAPPMEDEQPSPGPRKRRRVKRICDLENPFRFRLRVFYLAQKFAIFVMHQFTLLLQSIGTKTRRNICKRKVWAVQPANLVCDKWECPTGWEALIHNFAAQLNNMRRQDEDEATKIFISFSGIQEQHGKLEIQGGLLSIVKGGQVQDEMSKELALKLEELVNQFEKDSASVCQVCGSPAKTGSKGEPKKTLCAKCSADWQAEESE